MRESDDVLHLIFAQFFSRISFCGGWFHFFYWPFSNEIINTPFVLFGVAFITLVVSYWLATFLAPLIIIITKRLFFFFLY